MKTALTFISLVLGLNLAYSAEEKYTERREGTSISWGSTLYLMDDKFPEIANNPTWQDEFLNVSVRNKIWLGLNPEAKLSSNSSVTVEVGFEYTDENGNIVQDNCILTANYDTDGLQIINDKSTYSFTGGHLIEAVITNVNVISGSIDDYVLQMEIIVDRFYHFDNGAITTCGITPISNNYLEFYWGHKAGAEEYELEYVHINDYTVYENTYKSAADLNYDFYKNSTRIITKNLHYKIPNVFDHGYLIFRVRGVGRTSPVIRLRKEGEWNLATQGAVSNVPSNQRLPITQEYDENMNWSYQAAMTENGKRLEGISYADGLGRPRQQLMHNPATEQVIVSNTYYDYHGRPVIQDLGTPIDDETLVFHGGFNLSAVDLQPYGPQHFDSENIGQDCPQLVHGFAESAGAGKYYSTANNTVDGADLYTPDAGGHPFAQIEYMPDQTGRIKRVGAYGEDHQIGNGNTTKYMYSTPTQEELNRLFGSEVGYAHQYQRRMMQDANGQIYVTYYDLAGRVIASGLAGSAPDGLATISGSDPLEDFELTLIDGASSTVPMTFSKSHSIESEGLYTFSYGLTPQEYEDACMETDVCFDCVYKLELIILHEECETEIVFSDELFINGEEYNKICSGEEYVLDTTIMLAQGDYNYTRILTIDPEATDEYWCLYLENNECIEDYSYYFNMLYESNEFSDCQDFTMVIIDSSDYIDPNDKCSSYRYMMKKQLSPTGQYALFDVNQATGELEAGNYPLSIFNPSNDLPFSNATWNNPPTPFLDNNGDPAMVEITEVSPGVYEPEVDDVNLLTPTTDPDVFLTPPDNLEHALDFVFRFEFSWAESFLAFHPESCYLSFCESETLSNDYDLAMDTIHSHEQACALGLYNPLGIDLTLSAMMHPCTTTVNLDPFFQQGGEGEEFEQEMINNLFSYAELGNPPVNFNLYWYAITMVVFPDETDYDSLVHNVLRDYPGDTCYNDRIWQTFKMHYQSMKEQYRQWAMTDYAMENNCYNGCFNNGSFDPADEITPPPPTNTFNEYTLQSDPTPIYPANNASQPCHANTVGYYADKVPVFGNYWNAFNSMPSSVSAAQNTFDSLQEVLCLSSCEDAADDWIGGLHGCSNITPALKASIKAELIELCQMGCGDPSFPNGVSSIGMGTTTNGNTSFEEILEYHLGSNYFEETCNIYLMPNLPPTHTAPQPGLVYATYLDDCGCDIIFQAKEDYETLKAQSNLPDGVESLIDMVEYNTGYLELDAQHLLCQCDKFYSGTWTGPGNWTSGDIAALNHAQIPVSSQMSCNNELTDCIDCQQANDMQSALVTYFTSQGVNDIEDDPNYVSILGNYFNHHLHFMLTGDDYDNFINGCNATEQDPYCDLATESYNLTDIINLLARRAQLLAPDIDPIDLETENIAYEKGPLNGVIGADYFACAQGQDCDDETLTLNFNSPEGDCEVVLDFGTDFALPLEHLIGFHSPTITQTDCANNSMFRVIADFLVCGELESHPVEVSTTCFETTLCACGDGGQTLCNDPYPTPNDPLCYKSTLLEMEINAMDMYQEELEVLYAEFVANFEAKCLAALDTETFTVTGDYQMYQFTLFYYDQAGNLTQTIAPEGVDYTNPSNNQAINTARNNVAGHNDGTVSGFFPDHEFVTAYHYNSYGQLTATTNPDQEGNTNYFYDRYGRIVASQNPHQALVHKYSYTLYDEQGRPWQVGQIFQPATLSESILKADDLGVSFENWLGNERTEVTITIYDEALSTAIANQFTNGQTNLRLRVASILYFDEFHPINTDIQTDYTTATHYSYDLHGNVVETIQDVPMMAPVAQDKKKTEYEFELISGNMKAVHYQKEEVDGYSHFYHYDELNRLREVETTTDNDVHRSTEARYHYYDYGPLARVEIGQHQVQGMDYAYTINGWIKGMNSNTLDPGRDMGNDSRIGYLAQNEEVHRSFAKDVFGYTVNYFDGDYQAVGGSSFEADYSGTALGNYNQDLFNGNIRHVVTAINGMDIQGYGYKYDQLQRLVEMQVFRDQDLVTNNNWNGAQATDDYKTNILYDKNGNILKIRRNGYAGAQLEMDNMNYDYYTINGERSNRLNYVEDAVQDYSGYDDIKQGQSGGNYTYNRIGELIKDDSEAMILEWRYGDHKLKEVIRGDDNSPNVEYIYDPLGTRVAKIVKPRQNFQLSPQEDWEVHYYVYNGQGQLMATYESKLYDQDGETILTEQFIYGVERHGHIRRNKEVYNDGAITPSTDPLVENILGKRRYEMKSYNDNVHVVITDRKTYNDLENSYEAVIVQKSEYYAFGMLQPGRHENTFQSKFGYHGMESDDEHKGDGNHYTTYFRQYDSRLGRWMSLDPASAMFPFESNYAANHNNPVIYIDYEGDSPLLVSFAIGVGTDIMMQFFKGFFSPNYAGKRFDFGYAFGNIDFADAILNGFVQMLLPAFGVFKEGITPIAKRWIKRAVKYPFKLLMVVIDFRMNFIRVEGKLRLNLQLEIAGLDEDHKFAKKREKVRKDFRLALIGMAVSEVDLISGQLGVLDEKGVFGGIKYGSGQEYKLSEFEGKFDGYYLVNQVVSNLTQQIAEGITKGLSIKKPPPKMVSMNMEEIDERIEAQDYLPEVKDLFNKKGSSPNTSDNKIDTESIQNMIEKGGKLERNE